MLTVGHVTGTQYHDTLHVSAGAPRDSPQQVPPLTLRRCTPSAHRPPPTQSGVSEVFSSSGQAVHVMSTLIWKLLTPKHSPFFNFFFEKKALKFSIKKYAMFLHRN